VGHRSVADRACRWRRAAYSGACSYESLRIGRCPQYISGRRNGRLALLSSCMPLVVLAVW